MNERLSVPAVVGAILTVVVAFVALTLWRTTPAGNARAYSEGTARMERSGALEQAEAAERARQALPEHERRAMDELVRDQLPQPEKDSR